MASRGRFWAHWCPNGCGKTVVYDYKKRKYLCMKCLNYFTKKEIE